MGELCERRPDGKWGEALTVAAENYEKAVASAKEVVKNFKYATQPILSVRDNMVLRVPNATEAFDKLYENLLAQNRSDSSRDGGIRGEILNAVVVIDDPTRGIVLSKTRNMPMRYAIGELLWYLSGSNSLGDITQYSEAWQRLSDDGETVNSAYGHRIRSFFGFDQWEHVKNLLRADPNSRQAVIHIKDASDKKTKDLPCTVSIQYFIRGNKLYSTVYMRSNDIWMGFPYDVFSFTALQVKLAMELGVGLGTYTHIAGSLHLYERNVKSNGAG